MTDHSWQRFIAAFNTQHYIDSVLALEELWFVDKNDFYKGLIRLCVGLNQLHLGLLTSPRFLLQTARQLLKPYAPLYQGVDLVALDAFIKQCLALIPADLETGQGQVATDLIPVYQLDLHAL